MTMQTAVNTNPNIYPASRFDREVMAACGFGYESYSKLGTLRKEAMYGDMSDYEIRGAILDKHELSDGMSFRELYQISGELSSVGLDGGLNSSLSLLWYDFGAPGKPGKPIGHEFSEREWHLDTKVTRSYVNTLKKVYSQGNLLPDYMTTLEQILSGVRY